MNEYCTKANSLGETQSSHYQRIRPFPRSMIQNNFKCMQCNATKMQEDFLGKLYSCVCYLKT